MSIKKQSEQQRSMHFVFLKNTLGKVEEKIPPE